MKTFASFASFAWILAMTTMGVGSACSTWSADEKEPIAETSHGISKRRVSIAGSLAYGQTSDLTAYRGFPTYSAYELTGNAGDELDVWVKSDDGDPSRLTASLLISLSQAVVRGLSAMGSSSLDRGSDAEHAKYRAAARTSRRAQ